MGNLIEQIRLAFVRPKIRSLPAPKTDSDAELKEYARRNNDYENAQRTEPLVLAYKMLAELAKSGRVYRAAVRETWPRGDDLDWPRKEDLDWPESEPEWPDGWRCGALLFMRVDGWQDYVRPGLSFPNCWFIDRGAYMFANGLTYEELKNTSRGVTDKQDSMTEMVKSLCCVVEHSEYTGSRVFSKPAWSMPDGSFVGAHDAKDFKSAVEDNIAPALLKRAAMGLDEQTRPDEP